MNGKKAKFIRSLIPPTKKAPVKGPVKSGLNPETGKRHTYRDRFRWINMERGFRVRKLLKRVQSKHHLTKGELSELSSLLE